jgi:hypothetical protein
MWRGSASDHAALDRPTLKGPTMSLADEVPHASCDS